MSNETKGPLRETTVGRSSSVSSLILSTTTLRRESDRQVLFVYKPNMVLTLLRYTTVH